jgi:hypothetical protein
MLSPSAGTIFSYLPPTTVRLVHSTIRPKKALHVNYSKSRKPSLNPRFCAQNQRNFVFFHQLFLHCFLDSSIGFYCFGYKQFPESEGCTLPVCLYLLCICVSNSVTVTVKKEAYLLPARWIRPKLGSFDRSSLRVR